MLLRAFTVYDNKALIYHPPFFAATDGAAVRTFQELVNDSSTSIGRHPADYSLFLAGLYDDQKGMFNPELPLKHVADATALIQPQGRFPLANGSAEATAQEVAFNKIA